MEASQRAISHPLTLDWCLMTIGKYILQTEHTKQRHRVEVFVNSYLLIGCHTHKRTMGVNVINRGMKFAQDY